MIKNASTGFLPLSLIIGIFFITTSTHADTYKLVNTKILLWGYQMGQIPSPGNGPSFFHFDDDGDLYIYCFDKKQHTLIKFNPTDKEIGRIVLDCFAQRMKVEKDKIFSICGTSNEIMLIDKDLKSVKKIKIKKEFRAWESKYMNGVIYRNELDKNPGERSYVYDEDDYEKAGSPDKEKNLNSKTDYVDQLTPEGELLFLKKPTGELVKAWDSNGTLINGILKIGEDKFSNLYFNAFIFAKSSNIGDSILLKISPEGKLLTSMYFKPDDVVNDYSLSGIIPFDADKDGNFYRMRTNKDGVLIDKWSDQ